MQRTINKIMRCTVSSANQLILVRISPCASSWLFVFLRRARPLILSIVFVTNHTAPVSHVKRSASITPIIRECGGYPVVRDSMPTVLNVASTNFSGVGAIQVGLLGRKRRNMKNIYWISQESNSK